MKKKRWLGNIWKRYFSDCMVWLQISLHDFAIVPPIRVVILQTVPNVLTYFNWKAYRTNDFLAESQGLSLTLAVWMGDKAVGETWILFADIVSGKLPLDWGFYRKCIPISDANILTSMYTILQWNIFIHICANFLTSGSSLFANGLFLGNEKSSTSCFSLLEIKIRKQ